MQYITGLEQYKEKAGSAVTLGKFDGLHRGHRKLVERVMEHVEEEADLKSVVCFFDMTEFKARMHLDGKKLMTNAERAFRLENRVDYLVECPFLSVKEMEAEQFIEQILCGVFHAKYIVVGENFRFGHERRGDTEMLKKYAKRYGYTIEVMENEMYGSRVVSSTYVREVMKTGDMYLVNRLLSYPYTIAGIVVKGDQQGREMGSPTMDIIPCEEKILPPKGTYICKIRSGGDWYQGVCNIGTKPTVAQNEERTLSAHLFCYEEKEEVYGREIIVQLYQYLRPERKFADVHALKNQIQDDIREGKRYFIQVANRGRNR
ncbi:riboflavin biosynthesis protein RibF [Drancourtella sp. An177]|nr:riboflavin biosynthesis protein RibF [Drancourtella sp. An177]